MGHWCRICGRTRPNERFSGKGHRIHVCQDCARLPKAQRDAINQEREILGYLTQSRISEQNLARLRTVAAKAAPSVAELAAVVVAVAEITPSRKGRLRVLARERGDLLAALERTGLIDAHHG
jgi:ribosome-binding protein aMBF1 (putative translation factor)